MRSLFRYICLTFLSRFGRKKISGETGVVSITTHGIRLNKVHATIESIIRGKDQPKELILWLDDEVSYSDLPTLLRAQIVRGLKVKLSRNFGPHTKYYPYVMQGSENQILVTADDDIIYPFDWFSGLLKAEKLNPGKILCYRARRITKNPEGSGFSNYYSWPICRHGYVGRDAFFTGVHGVLYPIAFQRMLLNMHDDFMKVCPFADDVWLNKVAIESDISVEVLAPPGRFINTPRTQIHALKHKNVDGGNNDRYIDLLLADLKL